MKKYFAIILILFTIISITTVTKSRWDAPVPKVYPLEHLDKFSFGFDNAISGGLWIRVLQNIDFCEGDRELRAVNKGTDMDEVLSVELVESRCNKGWVFQMLDKVTTLAPKFRKVYRVGAELLSIAVDDREGARIIFEKGLKVFPNYWELAYSASYHYLFEFQNPQRAADLLVQAADGGGPFWFRQMAGTLYTKSGQHTVAEVTLKSYLASYRGRRGELAAKLRLQELYVKTGLSKKEAEEKLELFLETLPE